MIPPRHEAIIQVVSAVEALGDTAEHLGRRACPFGVLRDYPVLNVADIEANAEHARWLANQILRACRKVRRYDHSEAALRRYAHRGPLALLPPAREICPNPYRVAQWPRECDGIPIRRTA